MCDLPHAADRDALSILSRYPIVRLRSAALPEAPRDEPRQVLLAEMLIEGRPLLVANTHLAWRPEMIAERKAQVAALLAAIAPYDTKSKLLCGDFNDDPDSPAVRLVSASGGGFHDAYAVCHPDDPGFTWSAQNPYVDPSTTRGQRIDYIFAGGESEAEGLLHRVRRQRPRLCVGPFRRVLQSRNSLTTSSSPHRRAASARAPRPASDRPRGGRPRAWGGRDCPTAPGRAAGRRRGTRSH